MDATSIYGRIFRKHKVRFRDWLLMPVLSAACSCNAIAGGWEYHKGKGYTLCDALYKRLNTYSYPDPLKQPNNCGWNAALSYPGFTEPPWQDLDPKEHEELIYRLLRYMDSNGRVKEFLPQRESFIRNDVKRFIEQGGRVQLWRTRLISDFFNKKHPERWTPLGLQNVIQLRYLHTHAQEEASALCPDVPQANWSGRVFVANDDLTDIHPDIGYSANYLWGETLVLHKGRSYFMAREADLTISLGWDQGSGPSDFCELDYKHIQPGRK